MLLMKKKLPQPRKMVGTKPETAAAEGADDTGGKLSQKTAEQTDAFLSKRRTNKAQRFIKQLLYMML